MLPATFAIGRSVQGEDGGPVGVEGRRVEGSYAEEVDGRPPRGKVSCGAARRHVDVCGVVDTCCVFC